MKRHHLETRTNHVIVHWFNVNHVIQSFMIIHDERTHKLVNLTLPAHSPPYIILHTSWILNTAGKQNKKKKNNDNNFPVTSCQPLPALQSKQLETQPFPLCNGLLYDSHTHLSTHFRTLMKPHKRKRKCCYVWNRQHPMKMQVDWKYPWKWKIVRLQGMYNIPFVQTKGYQTYKLSINESVIQWNQVNSWVVRVVCYSYFTNYSFVAFSFLLVYDKFQLIFLLDH